MWCALNEHGREYNDEAHIHPYTLLKFRQYNRRYRQVDGQIARTNG
jgi:hypothetical protein